MGFSEEETKGLPTYEDARNGGCFLPNCTHTLEYVDETVDAAEIELQKSCLIGIW